MTSLPASTPAPASSEGRDASRLLELRTRLQSLDDAGAASLLEALREQHAARVDALREAIEDEARALRALSVAQDQVALRGGLRDEAFIARWSALLNTALGNPSRFDELDVETRKMAGPRHVLVRPSMRVRTDNRQVVLALYPNRDETVHAQLLEFLLKALPILVNETAPEGEADWRNRAAILEVWSRNISDKEWLTLLAHPASGNYELVREWRSSVEVEKRFDTLREALDYLRENHAYY